MVLLKFPILSFNNFIFALWITKPPFCVLIKYFNLKLTGTIPLLKDLNPVDS